MQPDIRALKLEFTRTTLNISIIALMFTTMTTLVAEEKHHYKTDFSIEHFKERRLKILDTIGHTSIALVQGSSRQAGFSVFRQSNTFYYLTGSESDHAYLLLNGRNKLATL